MLFLGGFVITFSFGELLFKFSKALLVAFLSVILNARNLLLQSSVDAVLLGKGYLVVSQFLEWPTSRVQLRR